MVTKSRPVPAVSKRARALDPVIASVHRFRDVVGVRVSDVGGFAYLTAREARWVGEALIAAAASVEKESFIESNFPLKALTVSKRDKGDPEWSA